MYDITTITDQTEDVRRTVMNYVSVFCSRLRFPHKANSRKGSLQNYTTAHLQELRVYIISPTKKLDVYIIIKLVM